MKNTVTVRTRILEVITALLMIRPTISIISDLYSYNDPEMTEQLLKYSVPMLLGTIPLAIVIITRKYDRIWAKMLVILSVAANFLRRENVNYISNIGRTLRAYRDLKYSAIENLEYFLNLFMLFFSIAAGVILILTLFGKIKWKKRNSLLIYTYVMAGITAVYALRSGFSNLYYMELILIPCLIYELQPKTDVKAVIGWTGIIAAAVSDMVFEFMTKREQSSCASLMDYLNAGEQYTRMNSLIFAAAMLLMPLILFERRDPLERLVTAPAADEDEEDDESEEDDTDEADDEDDYEEDDDNDDESDNND
ncbi:hypothetical protein [uncultured Ruminococcus sp.]|uniref:hypothetical protein n=1 Tax=uncultured Ruminococcus sp. TaxID=165186 RepID=UPI00260CFB98|nr:hypothetical protein [uncultured Ruminococcus sp.]